MDTLPYGHEKIPETLHTGSRFHRSHWSDSPPLAAVQIRTLQKMEELKERTIAYLEGFIGREIQ
jgi:hypothetical protein